MKKQSKIAQPHCSLKTMFKLPLNLFCQSNLTCVLKSLLKIHILFNPLIPVLECLPRGVIQTGQRLRYTICCLVIETNEIYNEVE